ncbi:hypothetical protein EXN66_Car015639 [Channa argus]|uniref:Uncharacterized protein n=1 Tax=Channa argus TaxID=215402 RepID=A0A6G1QBN3_CHAAH|nr:hypothetical protein EXN66_Car015639 [Channa argus]
MYTLPVTNDTHAQLDVSQWERHWCSRQRAPRQQYPVTWANSRQTAVLCSLM